mmetsp:Transcript_21654/g.31067  ORF Transcript_21654/g.31067 Transcript_21654/m.31067 type:complete len:248 (+) Transcript_21654:353-1096(+)|eukprot:CAMPEP_0170079840 /NCGR_PEP_ID=MMETSP0019_2-20121128/16117_1 /TAXON_ID=98059 /ORGANISM="Dinobryon sp., Strain UTEXLB2267" /LENGTH=247 /DNA_ID=CAMNT_0010293491 /DNA_START=373 /DNA_END=1116 /DNA_ORIENTATION=+
MGINISRRALNDANPFIVSAISSTGVPLVIKVLRIDPDAPTNRKLLLDMEIQACEILELSNKNKTVSFIQAEIFNINLPENNLNIDIKSKMKVIVMPRYAGTITQSPKFNQNVIVREGKKLLKALKFMHNHNIVHMDVKGDNILLDYNGNWLLGDFGSCRFIGDSILSTTEMFYPSNILCLPAHPCYDYFMLLVVLLIESLEKKRYYREVLMDGIERVSLEKVHEMVAKSSPSEDYGQLLRELLALA